MSDDKPFFDIDFSKKGYYARFISVIKLLSFLLAFLIVLLVFFVISFPWFYKIIMRIARLVGIKKGLFYFQLVHLHKWRKRPQSYPVQHIYQDMVEMLCAEAEKGGKRELIAFSRFSYISQIVLTDFVNELCSYSDLAEACRIAPSQAAPDALMSICRFDAIPHQQVLELLDEAGCSDSRRFLSWLVISYWHALPLTRFFHANCPQQWRYEYVCSYTSCPDQEISFDAYADDAVEPDFHTEDMQTFYSEVLANSKLVEKLFEYADEAVPDRAILSEKLREVCFSYRRISSMHKDVKEAMNNGRYMQRKREWKECTSKEPEEME